MLRRTALLLFAALLAMPASGQAPLALRVVESDTDLRDAVGGHSGVVVSDRLALLWTTDDETAALRRLGLDVDADPHARHASRPDRLLATDLAASSRAGLLFKRTGPAAFEHAAPDHLPDPTFDPAGYHSALRAAGLDPDTLAASGHLVRADAGGQVQGNSDQMIGEVSVSLFFVESDGSLDPDEFSWTASAQDAAFAQTVEGLLWWSQQARRAGHVLAFRLHRYPANHPASRQPYEPVRQPSDDLFIAAVLADLGYTAGDSYQRLLAFNTWQRAEYGADAAFAAFFVANPPDQGAPATFPSGYGAYAGSEDTVVLSTWMGAMTFAHETGHIFRAPDEYSNPGYGGCTTGLALTASGIVNGNCEAAHLHSVSCIMRTATADLCAYTSAHVGWTDRADELLITSEPAGMLVQVEEIDGQIYAGAGPVGTTPLSLPYGPDRQVRVSIRPEQPIRGAIYRFDAWADGETGPTRVVETSRQPQTLSAKYVSLGPVSQSYRIHGRSSGLEFTQASHVAHDGETLWVSDGQLLAARQGGAWSTVRIPPNDVEYPYASALAAGGGTVWAVQEGAVGSDLVRYRDETWSRTTLPVATVTGMVALPDGRAVLAVGGRVLVADASGWAEIGGQPTLSRAFTRLALDPSGRVLALDETTLARWTPDSGTWTTEAVDETWPVRQAERVHVDAQGALWVARVGTVEAPSTPLVARRSVAGWTAVAAATLGMNTGDYFLPVTLDHDATGRLWVAGLHGVLGVTPSGGVIDGPAPGPYGSYVSGLSVSPSGWPVAGLPEAVSERRDGVWTPLAAATVTSGTPLASDSEGAWVGATSALYYFDGFDWQPKPLPPRLDGSPAGRAGLYDLTVAADVLWAGTAWGVMSLEDGAWELVGPQEAAYTIQVSEDGTVWAVWSGGRIARITASGTESFAVPVGTSQRPARRFARAPDGAVWTGSDLGISRLDGTEWTTFASLDGVPAGETKWIAAAGDHVWATGTFPGLVHYDGDTWSVLYETDDRFPGGFASPNRVWGEDGRVWVTTREGLHAIDTEGALTLVEGSEGLDVADVSVGSDGTVWLSGGRGDVLVEINETALATRNRSPQITSTAPGRAWPGGAFAYAVHAHDFDDDPLQYQLESAPDWLTVEAETGVVSGTPPNALATYHAEVVVRDGRGGQARQAFAIAVDGLATAAGGDPASSYLDPIRPNPTRGRAAVSYGLAEAADVEVTVHDMLGRRVAVLADGPQPGGTYGVAFDASAVAPGAYVVTVRIDGSGPAQVFTQVVTVVR